MSTVEDEVNAEMVRGPFDDLVSLASAPLSPAESGNDPRYLDEFLLAKQEIDKLTGTDFESVERNCRTILTEHAKDLRVAGYLTLAMSIRHGIGGLDAGLRITRALLESFWESCHPTKEKQRRSALEWSNSPRFVGLIEKLEPGNEPAVARSIVETLSVINTLLAEKLKGKEDVPQWISIRDWAEKQHALLESRMAPPPSTQSVQTEQAGVVELSPGSTAVVTLPASSSENTPMAMMSSLGNDGGAIFSSVDSESGLVEAVRGLIAFFQNKGDRARAAAFARALRWGGLRQPPNEGGKTRIPAPRRNAWRSIDEAEQAGDLESAFWAAESAFFEPGSHFAIDLQLRAYEVARALRDDALVLTIESHVSSLVKRIPNIVSLRFDDDTPFSSGAALSWIETLTAGAGGTQSGSADDTMREVATKAQELHAEKGLTDALRYMDTVAARSGRERFALELSKADMLLRGNRADIAEALLTSLVELADSNRLDEWEPKYAVDARFKLRRALEQRLADAGDGEKKDIKGRIDALGRAIGRIDATLATTML